MKTLASEGLLVSTPTYNAGSVLRRRLGSPSAGDAQSVWEGVACR
jgi:hypothetical protein